MASPGHQETEALLTGTGRAHLFARTSIVADFFVEACLGPDAVALAAGEEGIVDVTGPEALTAAEIAATAGLLYDALDDAEYRRRLAAAGSPGWLVEAFASMFASVREGRFATVSADVPRLIGQPQEPFAGFLSRQR